MIYRIIIKVGYNESFFDFASAEDAAAFARVALAHMVSSEDTKKPTYIQMLILNPLLKESEED